MSDTFKKFSAPMFLLVNVATLVSMLLFISIAFPSLFAIALSQSWLTIFATFVLVHFATCFIEFFFHRYVLHKQFPYLGHFYAKHTHHHSLTTVSQTGAYNSNDYPIIREEQLESSFFPWYTLLIFSIALTPVFVLIAFMYPTIPVLISGYIALLWAIVLYEFIHQLLHLPFEGWEKIISNKKYGEFIRKAYSLHLAHHANPRNNESISGFFGIPFADIIFNTIKVPQNLYTPREPVHLDDYVQTKPVWFIQKLDGLLKMTPQHPEL